MKRTKSEKAITLVALIITIIVLLILAVVAIRAVTGDGIIAHAKNARDQYEQKTAEENTLLSNLTGYITGQLGGNGGGNDPVTPGGDTTPTIASSHLNTVLSTTANTKLVDKYGNKITVPAGFKIVVDNTSDVSKSTSYTADTIDVTKGIVVEDGVGNQFVWIPVGNIKTSTTDTVGTPITLGRYSWSGSTGTLVQPIAEDDTKSLTSEVAISLSRKTYRELQPRETGKVPNGNAVARNINDFYTSTITNGGYYLGRYEASSSGTNITVKANQDVYVIIEQPDASEKAKTMYADGYSSGTYSSDLVNSYAWDTAIIFIQTFGTEEDASSYASKNKSTSFAKTGVNPDKYCNIYDLSGNETEWTTEACTGAYELSAIRGGCYIADNGRAYFYTSTRDDNSVLERHSGFGFRPLLYMAINS